MWLGSQSITRRPIDIRAKRCICQEDEELVQRLAGGGGVRCV